MGLRDAARREYGCLGAGMRGREYDSAGASVRIRRLEQIIGVRQCPCHKAIPGRACQCSRSRTEGGK